MVLSTEDAFEALELPYGSDFDSIRTSYKRLALKWHPEKHNHSLESVKKFQSISLAFKKLSGEEDSDEDSDSDLKMDDMLHQFKEVFFYEPARAFNGFDSSDDDESDDDDDDDDDGFLSSRIYPNRGKISDSKRSDKLPKLTDEEINKNAQELISEEEKEKRRAEKRRAKKKRQRERKKLEKQVQNTTDDKKPSQKKSDTTDSKGKSHKKDKKPTESSSDEDDFDQNSAFFTKVVNKKKKGTGTEQPVGSRKDKNKEKQMTQSKGNDEETEELDPVVLRSRQLAIRGNEMAQLGHYSAAIDLFTEAIKLDPSDFRFFGNRSYCFDRIQQYDKALRDAEKAILLSPDWPKGYFRKGRALAGLKFNADAEQAFMQVLKLDKNCEDAMQELLRVRTQQLIEMGFSRQQAETAIKQHGTVQTALDSLLAVVAENSLATEVYMSDDDDLTPHSPAPPPPRQQIVPHIHTASTDTKMDPCNPEGLTALWVGNVLPEVSDKKLSQMFSRYGEVTSVRCLPDKFCAFVNFKHKDSAGRAMHGLQGVECGGQRLLIKFPDNPIR
ncbi:uncharacterized protein LOC135467776 isoform X2 [Liolophura sinensis]|uniref:uncharacterized protein LOC135467776 isoform X2 n=1 Tax=Liolophura sinensis TaxID=3198878 RepID=UPI003158B06A